MPAAPHFHQKALGLDRMSLGVIYAALEHSSDDDGEYKKSGSARVPFDQVLHIRVGLIPLPTQNQSPGLGV